MSDLKIYHVCNYAPNLAGMYGSVRDLILAERRAGLQVEMFDDLQGEFKSLYGSDGITPVGRDFGDASDIICWHHAMLEDWQNETHRNMVLFLHGTPEHNFLTELYDKTGKEKPFSLTVGLEAHKICKGFITMWKRHVPFWESALRRKVHYVPSWVDLTKRELSPLTPESDVIRIGMEDFWRICREPYNLFVAIDCLRKMTKKKIIVNVWGLPEMPNDTYKAAIQWLVEDDVMFLQGITNDTQGDILYKNDMILSMSTEETRVVREAYACGVPVVCGRGPLEFTKYSADNINPIKLAKQILRCHEDLCKDVNGVRAGLRTYAETNFDCDRAAVQVKKIFEDIVKTHGSINYPKLPKGIKTRMVASVHTTADKLMQRMSDDTTPTAYIRFGDGDILLMEGEARESFHKNSPELQKALTKAFKYDAEGWMISSVAGMLSEGQMRPGLFAPHECDPRLIKFVQKYHKNETLDNAVALLYKAVFEPSWFMQFVKKCIHGKRVLFIGNQFLCNNPLLKLIFRPANFIEIPDKDAFYALDDKMWLDIETKAQQSDMVICAAGMATRVIAHRLWTRKIRKHFLDIGSFADAMAGLETRTWIKMVGKSVRENFETLISGGKTDIIIATYNNEDKTIQCMESIAKHTRNYRVIWVDNGSSPESIEKVKAVATTLEDCDIIRLPENVGFSKAVNLALRKAMYERTADYVALLNNDTIVTEGWLSTLQAAIVSNGFAAVGPLTSENNPQSLDKLKPVIPALPVFNSESPDKRADILSRQFGIEVFRADNMLSFFCCVMPMSAVEAVGLLDDNIFAYGEDNDYCERMARLNLAYGICLGAYVHHDHSVTSKQMGEGWIDDQKKIARAYLKRKWAKK